MLRRWDVTPDSLPLGDTNLVVAPGTHLAIFVNLGGHC